jgi:hypothetical protein
VTDVKRITVCILLGGVLLGGSACAPEPGPRATDAPDTSDAAFLDDLERRTFDWFWQTANPANGLVPDRAPDPPFSSIAAIGFGLTAYGIGAERGYVSREAAAERTLTTLRFLWEAPQGEGPDGVAGHRGFFFHFLDMDHGLRFQTTELSTIDTALLMAGVLFAQSWFDADDASEAAIRAYADSLYLRAEWPWFQRDLAPLITMGWRPEHGGFGRAAYQGLNEAMILYVLALGSPTHPVEADVWDAWTSTYEWGDFHGYEHVQFSPLFGHQYSHVWIDYRGIADAYMRERGIDYFENSRRATLSQRAYAIENPSGFEAYGPDVWGLTACDGPAGYRGVVRGDTVQFHRYWARGASLLHVNDDGTIAPTAAGGSIPFASTEAVAALREMQRRWGPLVYNEYGFVDAFNPTFTFTDADLGHGFVDPDEGWFDDQQLGIDQGPIVAMIENHRSGLVWETMKRNPHVVRGLCRAGFTGGWLEGRCDGNGTSPE